MHVVFAAAIERMETETIECMEMETHEQTTIDS